MLCSILSSTGTFCWPLNRSYGDS